MGSECDGSSSSSSSWLKDGVLHVIDLAGSESAADSKGHDKQRLAETKAMNVSLIALKDCVRARSEASKPGKSHQAHVPYRRLKLTLLMKDVFDVAGQKRRSATVVIGCVSPLARDAAHSNNTLSYAAPLRTTTAAMTTANSNNGSSYELDDRDPSNWSNNLAHVSTDNTTVNTAHVVVAVVATFVVSPASGQDRGRRRRHGRKRNRNGIRRRKK